MGCRRPRQRQSPETVQPAADAEPTILRTASTIEMSAEPRNGSCAGRRTKLPRSGNFVIRHSRQNGVAYAENPGQNRIIGVG